MKKFVEVSGTVVEGTRLLRRVEVQPEPTPLQKLMTLRDQLRGDQPDFSALGLMQEKLPKMERFISNSGTNSCSSSPTFGLPKLNRRQG